MKRSGARVVWEELAAEGVRVVFGMPGGSIMPTYHPLSEHRIRHVLIRHEQAAAHAADGYARVSGDVGVAITTSGPGATNLTTGIATAMMDSIPLVCITGQVATGLIGTDAFQEADITGITLPITKHNYLVTDVDALADTIHEAFHIARSGRPGPVLIDLPKDVQIAETEVAPVPWRSAGPFAGDGAADDDEAPAGIDEAAMFLRRCRRPVILAGQGVVRSGAADLLRQLAERCDIPVTTTLLGKPAFPWGHRLALGMMGMHGTAEANLAIQEADLLIALGMRFDDRVTGRIDAYAPMARKIHVDLDESEINKIVPVDVAIVADVRRTLRALVERCESIVRDEWRAAVDAWRGESRERDLLGRPSDDVLCVPRVIDELRRQTAGEAIVVADVGQNQMWAAQYYGTDGRLPFVTSGGLGTMGFSLPASIGAQLAAPDAEVWSLSGDGGFQMNLQELATVAQEGLPLRIAVLNNGYLGMVRQWQEFFYDERYESTRLLNPDFVRLAEAYGIPAWSARTPGESREAIAASRGVRGPALIEFQTVVDGDEANVYPMVPSGAALHEMIRRPVPIRIATRRGDV